jgi:hypothetical protein
LLFLGNFDVLDFLGRVNALVFAVGRIDEVFIDEAQVFLDDGFLK